MSKSPPKSKVQLSKYMQKLFASVINSYRIKVNSHIYRFNSQPVGDMQMVYMFDVSGNEPTQVASMLISFPTTYNNKHVIYLARGETKSAYRRMGFGRALRAMITLAASESGFDIVKQYSFRLNKTQYKNPLVNEPISGIITKELGFKSSIQYPNYKTFKFNNSNSMNTLRKVISNYKYQQI